jgi:hypothetical protein
MRKTLTLAIVTFWTQLLFPHEMYGQVPNLGAAGDFVLFSSVGAVSNTGISQLTGNIGTNSGAISGFGNVNGVMHSPDVTTTQAVTDLQAAWFYLVNLAVTSVHAPVLGNGETLFAGVYALAAAGSVVGILTLDGQGDSNALFVIKTGGALTTAASATVNLINGALACNVFWVAEGAISMATFTTMRGTLIAHNAAIDMGAGGTIEGRALSTTGAVSVYGTLAYIPTGCSRPVLSGPLAPTLNSLSCYALFSSNGAVSNAGATHVTGDIGSGTSSVAGYNPVFVIGTIHLTPDLSTAQCAVDLNSLYAYLNTLPYDIELLYPAQFGNKLVLTPHTYRMNAAAIFTDTLYLDAQGNANAIFVIQVDGALTTSTFSTVRLINGAQAKNVFWKVEGAVTINDNSIFCGTIVCNNGSIILNTGVAFNGGSFTTLGTVNTTAITANNAFGGLCAVILALELTPFTASCNNQNVLLKWSTGIGSNTDYFTVERSNEGQNWYIVGKVTAKDSSSLVPSYSLTDWLGDQSKYYYRLMQTDFNGIHNYGIVVTVEKCGSDENENITLTPNPSAGKFTMSFTGDRSQCSSTEVYNSAGGKVYESIGFQSKFDLSDKMSGIYLVQIHLKSKTICRKMVVKRL